MKKAWENPELSNLLFRTTEENVCPGYSYNEVSVLAVQETDPTKAPYCECATCDGVNPPNGHSNPIDKPCAYRGLKNPKCSA